MTVVVVVIVVVTVVVIWGENSKRCACRGVEDGLVMTRS